MKNLRILSLYVVLSLVAAGASAQWTRVADGVEYQRFRQDSMDVHVTRIDLTDPDLRIVASRESERGLPVSEFAERNRAIVAINADYFTKDFRPIGLAVGPCGKWEGTTDTKREGVVAIGDGRAEIYAQSHVLGEPERWMEAVVSGWPLLVRNCVPLTAGKLPGSDAFTRAPHPRTAVGISEDGMTLFFVVADGRREGVPGLTLARLADFMADELGICAAMNLDGGGSSAMWVDDEIVNRPSDGAERRVAVHLGVVRARDYTGCETNVQASH
ncbi:MAG TPA: phosphodiester glycosidase family protein [Thermoanaerobaculia bacterium]|nr:phosphodiester glycosidase family protein [Thermoanaerobaculia bacterium]